MSLPTPVKCIPSVTYKSFLLHLIAFLWSCFGTYKDQTVYNLPAFNSYGGRFQYLTLITAYLCLISYGLSTLVDLVQIVTGHLEDTVITKNGYKQSKSILISIRDDLISFWCFTLSTFVAIMFWGIAAVDLRGIHTEEEEKVSPLFGWYNHYLHTTPILTVFILITNVNYGYSSFTKSIIYTITLGTSYLLWVNHLAKVTGNWVYPFMGKLTSTQYLIFCIFCHIVFFIIYLVGRKLSATVWNSDYKEKVIIDVEQKQM